MNLIDFANTQMFNLEILKTKLGIISAQVAAESTKESLQTLQETVDGLVERVSRISRAVAETSSSGQTVIPSSDTEPDEVTRPVILSPPQGALLPADFIQAPTDYNPFINQVFP